MEIRPALIVLYFVNILYYDVANKLNYVSKYFCRQLRK